VGSLEKSASISIYSVLHNCFLTTASQIASQSKSRNILKAQIMTISLKEIDLNYTLMFTDFAAFPMCKLSAQKAIELSSVVIEVNKMMRIDQKFFEQNLVYNEEKSFCILQTKSSGRGLFSTKFITENETIFTEKPVAVGPSQSVPNNFCCACGKKDAHGKNLSGSF